MNSRVLKEKLSNDFIPGLCPAPPSHPSPPTTGAAGPDHVSGANVHDAVRSVQPLQEVREDRLPPDDNRT